MGGMDDRITAIARAAKEAGGRALVVGGYARDLILARDPKDVDVEVLGLDLDALEQLLGRFGKVHRSGRAFDTLRISRLDVDFSVPEGGADVGLDYHRAARRRDLTLNSMAIDPLTDELLDPYDGRADIEARVLRATHPDEFVRDPLRALRVAQFAARFEMAVEPELRLLCEGLDLAALPGERVYEEFRKLLLQAERPSLGLAFLAETRLVRFYAELAALQGTPQDEKWHPEGDVWTHTLMVVDEAAKLRCGNEDDLALMLGALCHDLGKPLCTHLDDGRIKSPGHDRLGIAPCLRLLDRWRAPKALTRRVCALVEHHLAPALFVKNGAGARGYRRLARSLERSGVSLELLLRVARADHLGRTTQDALAGDFPAGDTFRERASKLAVEHRAPVDVVLGRHLIARGLTPGPHFGEILRRCRELQDELGETSPDRLLDRVL
jgi:tRNA nucleotidyltransferase (CCA-adding enzyme)